MENKRGRCGKMRVEGKDTRNEEIRREDGIKEKVNGEEKGLESRRKEREKDKRKAGKI